LKELTEQKHKLENKTNEQEAYIKKQLVSQTAATFAKKKEIKANEKQEKKLNTSQHELDTAKAALAKVKVEEAQVEKKLADQVIDKKKAQEQFDKLSESSVKLNATLSKTKKELETATLAAQKERKFQEEVKKQLQNEVQNLKKSN
jgi:hypothetical protein